MIKKRGREIANYFGCPIITMHAIQYNGQIQVKLSNINAKYKK
jgi:hypothetical protein